MNFVNKKSYITSEFRLELLPLFISYLTRILFTATRKLFRNVNLRNYALNKALKFLDNFVKLLFVLFKYDVNICDIKVDQFSIVKISLTFADLINYIMYLHKTFKRYQTNCEKKPEI